MDLSANQNDVTQHETFQLEYDGVQDHWFISTFESKYWAFGVASTVQASSTDTSSRASFRLCWNTDDGTCSLVAVDPNQSQQVRTLSARKSGQLFTGGPETIRFYVKFLNRTSISLRGANASGFVGTKGLGKLCGRVFWEKSGLACGKSIERLTLSPPPLDYATQPRQ